MSNRNPNSAPIAPARESGGAVQVAVAVPLRRVFDYRWDGGEIAPGTRVKVPFGRRRMIGVVVSNDPPTARRLRRIEAVIDDESPFSAGVLELLIWAARYYHHPLGEALHAALPTALRQGKALSDPNRSRQVRALADDDDTVASLARAPAQARLYEHLRGGDWIEASSLRAHFGECGDALRKLRDKGLIEIEMRAAAASSPTASNDSPLELNTAQRDAVDAIAACAGKFGSFLLHGITGSGKTEVYLEAARRVVADGAQALLLVPEIALTPQLVARVRARLGDGVCVLHSGLTAEQRYRAWHRARSGDAVAVLGTRSAVFTPLRAPGLIVVDEEHDISYKQQDGFRYHARDLALKRASIEGVPVVLGSATPSMETRHNVDRGRHRLLEIGKRAGTAQLPRIEFIDLTRHRPREGISTPLLNAIGERLAKREQSIVFVNRRGFAPVAQCHACGWQAQCRRCDARLTYHHDLRQFRCHHCGAAVAARMECGECGEKLALIGAGTQRIERHLHAQFPDARISRLDRDRLATARKLERELDAIRHGEIDIIIGTQLIAKGHDFAAVTLVGVVNSDQGLYSGDFRAPEYLFQQLTQVSGRAGRGRAPGLVLIQTAHPQHRTLQAMRAHDFDGFARDCLDERRAAAYPPFCHLALWRAESTEADAALQFLRHVALLGRRIANDNDRDGAVEIMDAVISSMERLAGRYRAQLLARSGDRGALHQLLARWVAAVEDDPKSKRARWSLDVDPMEMF